MDELDAILLDVGGVLLLPDHDLVLGALGGAGLDVDTTPDDLDRAHYAGSAALDDFPAQNAEIWSAYQRAYARELGVADDDLDRAEQALNAVFQLPQMFSRPVPGAVESLGRLAATGLALAIVSNAQGQIESVLRDAGLCHVGPGDSVRVAAIIDSHVVGVAKPDPRIFEIALEAVGVEAGRAAHVGDVVGADVAGALAAGVQPLHMDPYGFCRAATHRHVGSLDDVIALVRAS